MAMYKYSNYLQQNSADEFDKTYSPGNVISWSGIYRCMGCNREIVHTHEKPLPPQNHHQHTTSQGSIRWKLTVTDYTPSA
jgi:hypothetical protein